MRPEGFELAALRRVSEDTLTVHAGGYVHAGRPVTGELAEALVRQHTASHLAIGPPGPDGHQPVHTTAAGAARPADLGSSGRSG